MKLKTLKIKNFRSYKNEVEIDLCNLTAFVGKNDIGKSTILETLNIFFNGSKTIKMEESDINKQAKLSGDTETYISVCFEDLPSKIIIDSTNETTLQSEYLLNKKNQFEIKKIYINGGSEKIVIKAYHPANPECADLLLKKNEALKDIIDKKSIACSDKTKNAVMRTAIWEHYNEDLQLDEIEFEITKGEEIKSIWDKIKNFLPIYMLFQSDRTNNDSDSEIQDPLKAATRQILSDIDLKQKLEEIAVEVKNKLDEVANRTLDKLKEIDFDVANSLNPMIPPTDSLDWVGVFKKVSISGDEDISINKRGSGVKRLILLSFFRAEAERRMIGNENANIIYAVEEPETSQHTENQKLLVKAFLELAKNNNTQVIITTHSATIVKELDYDNLRLITSDNILRTVSSVKCGELPYPSLNEVNFLAFSEIAEEYHIELYGFIESKGMLRNYKSGKPERKYIKLCDDGSPKEEKKILTEYIRHQIHHPENANNIKYTREELETSICLMRDFIEKNNMSGMF